MDDKDNPFEAALRESFSAPEVPASLPAPAPARKRQGFAAMNPELARRISSLGGRAAQREGKAHRWSKDEARRAGSKGAAIGHAKGTAHRWTVEEARSAGRKGGETVQRERRVSRVPASV